VCFLALWTGCSTETVSPPTPFIEPPPGILLEGAVVAGVTVQPKIVAPGESVVIAIHVPDSNVSTLTLVASPMASATIIPMKGVPDGALGTTSLTAPNGVGDWHLILHGDSASGPVVGHALVHITEQSSCNSSETMEAHQCLMPDPGHRLKMTGAVLVNVAPLDREAPDARLMIHPRAAWRYKDTLVGCHTDSIGIIPLGALTTPSRNDNGGGPNNDSPLIAEMLMTAGGLDACENLVIDPLRRLAMVASRGDSGKPGGLSTWSLPESTANPLEAPTHLATWTDEHGLEGLALTGDRLYAAAKPNRVLVFSILADGSITLVNEVTVPGLTSAWHVAADANHLYVTDAGHDGHVHTDEEHSGGHLFVLDRSNPDAPAYVGVGNTTGSSKGLALLPDHTVAVASGASGIDLFDVTQPWSPNRMTTVDTPHSVTGLAYHAGYLLAADWETVRLYDTSDRGVLRLLDASDFNADHTVTSDNPESPFAGMVAASFVSMTDEGFVISEFDHVMTGTLTPGLDAPRLTLQDRRRVVTAPETGAPLHLAIRMRNDGREPLWVSIQETVYVTTQDHPLILGPGEAGAMDVQIVGLDQPDAPETILLDSNDPTTPTRSVTLIHAGEGYTVGSDAPDFHLPIVHNCVDGACPAPTECFRLHESLSQGKPILLAFFSTW